MVGEGGGVRERDYLKFGFRFQRQVFNMHQFSVGILNLLQASRTPILIKTKED
jgi:hypothetical protein